MSGGHFEYNQYRIGDIADSIEEAIREDWGFGPDTIAEFKNAVDLLRKAEIYVQRIDWLLSGDDGEDNFHERLKEDLGSK